jgi:hypothetical protein
VAPSPEFVRLFKAVVLDATRPSDTTRSGKNALLRS